MIRRFIERVKLRNLLKKKKEQLAKNRELESSTLSTLRFVNENHAKLVSEIHSIEAQIR